MTDVMDVPTQSARVEAEQWLEEYLRSAPLQAARSAEVVEAAAAFGISRATLDRARRRLGVRSVRERARRPQTIWVYTG